MIGEATTNITVIVYIGMRVRAANAHYNPMKWWCELTRTSLTDSMGVKSIHFSPFGVRNTGPRSLEKIYTKWRQT